MISRISFGYSFLLLALNFSSAYSQDTTTTGQLIFFASQKQKGFYRSFAEFRNNKPSIPYEGSVEEKIEFLGISGDTHTAYRLQFKDSLPCAKKTPVWGFCDGNSIFISRSSKLEKKSVYDRVIFLGRYIYYRSTEYRGGAAPIMTPMAGGGGMMMMGGGGGGKVMIEYMINANTGWEEQLTKEVVKELIVDDHELSQAFEEEKKKRKVLGEYVIKYAVKHHDEIRK